MDLGLKDKVAIVTGGSEGIGKATAISMANEGAKVVICARTQQTLDDAAKEISDITGSNVLTISADVRDPEQIEKAIQSTIAAFGRLDIVVNNAGTSAGGNFETVDDEAWRNDMDLKFYAAIRFSRLAIPHMKEVGGGRIINVTNLGGKQPGPNSVPTSVTRAAGIALTKALSKDLAKHNILVNAIAPGLIDTRFHKRLGRTTHDMKKRVKLSRLKRFGQPKEIAAIINCIISEEVNFITGEIISISGGDWI